jgi:hypothetical protein
MPALHPFAFFERLVWLDGTPLLDTIEEYRRQVFTEVFTTFDGNRPKYNRVLIGRAKKNNKTTDLALAALYKFLACDTANNDALIVANDEDQASDDLSLIKKLIAANPILAAEVKVLAKEIHRRDGRGVLKVLPGQDAVGAHGKTYAFLGFDEIHGLKNYDLFEALSPDPTRNDYLIWYTSYAGIRHRAGIPLHDLFAAAKAGSDPRLFFQWYSASFTTDEALQGDDISPEDRANPSRASWAEQDYLEGQRQRLPSARYRRLHLNEPGSLDGGAFSAEHLFKCVVPGRRRVPYQPGRRYFAVVDMSGGSNDDAALAIAHRDPATNRAVLDLVANQGARPPFDPRRAVQRFVALLREYGIALVYGDNYAGETFKHDFMDWGVNLAPIGHPHRGDKGAPNASEWFEALEPRVTALEIELLDVPELIEQALGLVWRGQRIDHEPGGHNDWIDAAAKALMLASPAQPGLSIAPLALENITRMSRGLPAIPAELPALPADAYDGFAPPSSRERFNAAFGLHSLEALPSYGTGRLAVSPMILQRARQLRFEQAAPNIASPHDIAFGASRGVSR